MIFPYFILSISAFAPRNIIYYGVCLGGFVFSLCLSGYAMAQSSQPVTNDVFFEAEGSEGQSTIYFDSKALLPVEEPVAPVAADPLIVDPSQDTGLSLILVERNGEVDSEGALLMSAQRAMKLGRYEAALDMYERLYKNNDRDPRILMGRAVSMQYLGQFEAAMQAYDGFLELDPENVEVHVNMLGVLGTKYPSVAIQRLEELRRSHPAHAGVVAQLAVNYGQIGDFDNAFKYLGVASSMDPQNALHVFNMAVMADRSGDKEQAVDLYERALDLDSVYGRGQSISRDSVYERLTQLR